MVAKPALLLVIMDFDDNFLIQHSIYNCFSYMIYHVFGDINEREPLFFKIYLDIESEMEDMYVYDSN